MTSATSIPLLPTHCPFHFLASLLVLVVQVGPVGACAPEHELHVQKPLLRVLLTAAWVPWQVPGAAGKVLLHHLAMRHLQASQAQEVQTHAQLQASVPQVLRAWAVPAWAIQAEGLPLAAPQVETAHVGLPAWVPQVGHVQPGEQSLAWAAEAPQEGQAAPAEQAVGAPQEG